MKILQTFRKSKNTAILLRRGLVVTGDGKKVFRGDVAVRNGFIAAIAPAGTLSRSGHYVLELSGEKVVCPGFIDMHSHSDVSAFTVPFMDSKLMQGVTTEVVGNCGLSPAPCSLRSAGHLGEVYGLSGRVKAWTTFSRYVRALKAKKTCLNIVPLAGQGSIHSFFMGYGNAEPSRHMLLKMKLKALECLREGAFGISLGLIYPPGCFSSSRELEIFFRAARQGDALITVHMRNEGERVIESAEEMIAMSRRTRARLHISHLKVSGKRNWRKIGELLSLIRSARSSGIPVTVDRYPYTASWTDLDAVLPDFVYAGGHEEEIRILSGRESREKVRQAFFENPAHRDKDFFSSIQVAQVRSLRNKACEGLTVAEIATSKGKDPFHALCDLLISEKLMVSAVFFGMHPGNMRRIISEPYAVIGSDASAKAFDASSGSPHPRAFGTFPAFFETFVKSGRISLARGVRKCTGQSADILRLDKRGYLREGFHADITVFDMEDIRDTSTYRKPVSRPEGIEYVMVNGSFAFIKGEIAGEKNGHVLLKT